jgi:predicted nucleotidyltransferase
MVKQEGLANTKVEKEAFSSAEVLNKYKVIAEKELINDGVEEVLILGSYGRLDGQPSSDLDIWLILNSTEDLDEIGRIANKEFQLRVDLAEEIQLPIATHWASIYDFKEAERYREIYSTRVGIPYYLREHIHLFKEYGEIEIPQPRTLAADWIVSLQGFIERENNLPDLQKNVMKWKRRIVQEYFYYISGERPKSKAEQDDVFLKIFEGDRDKLIAGVNCGIERVKNEFDLKELDLEKVRILQTVATTLEKVRWEFVTCINTPNRYINWLNEEENIGLQRRYAFTPDQILNIIHKYNNFFNSNVVTSEDLVRCLEVRSNGSKRTLNMLDFYTIFRLWSLDVLYNSKI